ncbi:MAG TPA: DivIVA domain-containing protein [Candidatus Hydrogenedentes bacterium]|nr:DivIVA domain-containing protein [Candidatus Hydrogenedentota bacterium]HQH54708.1 DivIVA domain-containing protein [Candidatus Hydrogenedentota bacterium]HQM47540.1 DivIVA domain-containing protein [Candidatus Hydrogenedentota bacterium]
MNEKTEEPGTVKKDRMITKALGEEIAITPSDIYNQDFKRAMLGGYETRQVDAFLERVADIIDRLLGQIRHLREKVDEQRAAIDEYREIEKTLRSALVSSQKFSEDILASAKREAESLIEEGRLKKAQAQLAAAKLPRKLARDIHVLEQQRSRMRREMLAILETHKNLLDSLIPGEDNAPAGFFDAGVTSDTGEDDEDSNLPVVNITDLSEEPGAETGGAASFSTETAESGVRQEGSASPHASGVSEMGGRSNAAASSAGIPAEPEGAPLDSSKGSGGAEAAERKKDSSK